MVKERYFLQLIVDFSWLLSTLECVKIYHKAIVPTGAAGEESICGAAAAAGASFKFVMKRK